MKNSPIVREVLDWFKTIIIAVLIALVLRSFVISPFKVSMTSMYPNLQPDDLILVEKLTYRFRDPKPGDVLVFHSPLGDNKDFVKRLIAVGGDEVEGKDGKIYINKELLQEPYIKSSPNFSFSPITVEKGKFFVLGDNRDNSLDSRNFGSIERKEIIGRVLFIFWPMSRWAKI